MEHIDDYSNVEKCLIYKYPLESNALPSQQSYCYITVDGRVWNPYTNQFSCGSRTAKIHGWTIHIHKQLASAFIPNPENKPYVVFKDGNKDHITVDNLVWSFTKKYVIGMTYNNLTVIKDVGMGGNSVGALIYCGCVCGGFITIPFTYLPKGAVKSCGCTVIEARTTHGFSKHPLYVTIQSMHYRCYKSSPDSDAYKLYQARGITICDEWSFDKVGITNFITWAKFSGYENGLTIDRIDNDGDYEPGNCRWVPMYIQNRNKRSNVTITLNNETKCLAEWSQSTGLAPLTIKNRLSKGLTPYDILS